MERRFRVEVTTTQAHFLEAQTEADAIAGAPELASMGARPAYQCEPVAVAELVADDPPVLSA